MLKENAARGVIKLTVRDHHAGDGIAGIAAQKYGVLALVAGDVGNLDAAHDRLERSSFSLFIKEVDLDGGLGYLADLDFGKVNGFYHTAPIGIGFDAQGAL